jgi:hypothetical protein
VIVAGEEFKVQSDGDFSRQDGLEGLGPLQNISGILLLKGEKKKKKKG